MDESSIRLKVQKELSPRRFQHVCGVVQMAEELAKRFGTDVEKARLAAWIHDYAREWPVERLTQTAKEAGVDPSFFEVTELLHGPIAAANAPKWFGIEDEDVRNAVRYHTSGRPGMSLLEKIVCLADAIEPGRRYPGVEQLRQIAEHDLEEALARQIDGTIQFLIKSNQPIFPLTVLARNELWEQVKAKKIRTGGSVSSFST
jgi:predicted HD superfamily hydrolase involved in NAD metabolism